MQECELDDFQELKYYNITDKYVYLPGDWLKNLGHLPPRVMATFVLALCIIDDAFSVYNERKCKVSYATIRDVFHLSDSYKGSNMRRFVEKQLIALGDLTINGIKIFSGAFDYKGFVYFSIRPEALVYFQGFGAERSYKQVWVEDIYGLTHCYAWDWYRMLVLRCSQNDPYQKFLYTVGIIKAELGLDSDSYVDIGGAFRRDSFCLNCIHNPLSDVAKTRMFEVFQHGKCGKYYYKLKEGKKNGDKVLGYYVTWRADFYIKSNNKKKED